MSRVTANAERQARHRAKGQRSAAFLAGVKASIPETRGCIHATAAMLHIAETRGDTKGVESLRAALEALWRLYDDMVRL